MKTARCQGTVTVLFSDLVGSTELLASMGEAAFDEFRRSHFAALRSAVEHHRGEEIKTLGDGILAVFGSAADAIAGAVAMQQGVNRQSWSAPHPVSIRIGLALGDVVFEDGDVFGVPVVEAARLVARARHGQILATTVVRVVAGRRSTFSFTDLGSMTLKGLPEAVPVSEVAWQPLVVPGVPLPALLDEVGGIFVGREAELERLGRLWKNAEAGGWCVALLAGEPGAGKTRLAAQVARRVHAETGVVLAGRCDEDLGVPFQPFVEALRYFMDHTPDHELLGRLGPFPSELARLVPELAVRLAALPPPLQADPETERYRLFDAVATWLATACPDRPVLLVLDDMHWAAKSTLLMLRHLLRPPGVPRLLVIATYRDTEIHPGHPLAEVLADLRRQGGVERFPIAGLDRDGVAALMAEMASHPLGDEDLALAHAIQRETEGNPFFVHEVLHHLTELGAIEPMAGRWALDRPLADLGIPEGVREVVLRRIGRLSQSTAAVLLVAAIAGRHFDIDVVAEATGIEVEAALESLDSAIAAGLVAENEQQPGWFSFTHALVTEALYENTTRTRRIRRHRQIGAAAAQGWAGQPERAAETARHWLLAAELDAATAAQACAYAAAAARVANARLAPEDAATLWQQALAAADLAGNDFDRYPLLIGLASSLYQAGHHLDGLPMFVRAINYALDEGGTQGTSRLVTAAVAAMGESNWYPIGYGLVDDELVNTLQRALPRLIDPVQRALVLSCLAAALLLRRQPSAPCGTV